jgi:queuine tRNA-ribosyltransferase
MASEGDARGGDSPIRFEVLATDGRARATRLTFTRGERACLTPMFMPVGTQGSLKGLTSQQLCDLECQVVLGNTYHLANRPGTEVLRASGGLAQFMHYTRGGTLTDSGGFQMVSLLDLADISEEGVTFQSPVDGQQMLLTPEKSMQIQNDIGADIIMALDDVVSSVAADDERFEEATHRTIRWIDRCIAAHANPRKQALFGIVQGGLDARLRKLCMDGLLKRDKDLPGYAIGGLAGGEEKSAFCKVVSQCAAALPNDKPRYVMGVGYPLDLVLCTALGADMYDCVYPSRTARFGTALVPDGRAAFKDQRHGHRLPPDRREVRLFRMREILARAPARRHHQRAARRFAVDVPQHQAPDASVQRNARGYFRKKVRRVRARIRARAVPGYERDPGLGARRDGDGGDSARVRKRGQTL